MSKKGKKNFFFVLTLFVKKKRKCEMNKCFVEKMVHNVWNRVFLPLNNIFKIKKDIFCFIIELNPVLEFRRHFHYARDQSNQLPFSRNMPWSVKTNLALASSYYRWRRFAEFMTICQKIIKKLCDKQTLFTDYF